MTWTLSAGVSLEQALGLVGEGVELVLRQIELDVLANDPVVAPDEDPEERDDGDHAGHDEDGAAAGGETAGVVEGGDDPHRDAANPESQLCDHQPVDLPCEEEAREPAEEEKQETEGPRTRPSVLPMRRTSEISAATSAAAPSERADYQRVRSMAVRVRTSPRTVTETK